jgi:tetratricopeptide (TPR) repeat protein
MSQDELFVQSGGRLKSIGKTGADGKLNVKMQRGSYNITASRAGERVQRQQVDIRPGSTTFIINLTGQLSTPGATTTANSNMNGTVATVPSATVEDVLKRFQDPKQTDSVTAADWQAVLSQTGLAFAQNPTDMRIKAQTLFARGQLAYLRGDYANALVAFNNSALTLPGSGLAYYGLGNAYLATNQLAEAVRAYQRAIELSGGLAMAYKGIGDALNKQSRSKDALGYYERARALGYASTSASMSTALNRMKLKRWSEALKELTEISRSHPSADVFMLMGDCYVRLEQPLSAAPAYRRATELNPRSAVAYAKYGEVMFDAREYVAAMEALERALVLDPSGSDINRARTRKLADQAARKARKMK